MAKINPLIFLFLLFLLHGVLAGPEGEDITEVGPTDDTVDDLDCEPEPVVPNTVTPPPLDLQDPPEEDPVEEEPPTVTPNTVTPPPLDIQDPPEEDPVEEEPPTVTPSTVTPPPLDLQDPPAEDPAEEETSITPYTITADQILKLAPSSESCETASPEFADECRTAEVAAKHISASFERYDISSRAEQAAILAWMVMESGEFRYSRNHFPPPGNPGQGRVTVVPIRGTVDHPLFPDPHQDIKVANGVASAAYNVQGLTFNMQYIDATPELQEKSSSVDLSSNSCGPETCTMLASAAHEVLNMILQGDQYAFATGAWFMKDICSDEVKTSLDNDPEKGWEDFMGKCVYAPMSAERMKYWGMAKEAVGLESEATESTPEEGNGNDPGAVTQTAPAATPMPSVLRREAPGNGLGNPEFVKILREDYNKFKDVADQTQSRLSKRAEESTAKSLRQRDFSGFLDVMFGNRLDTICTEPKSEPSVEEKRVDMSASLLALTQTIASCSKGRAEDKAICDGLPLSFSEQVSPSISIKGNTTLSYHEAYLSTLWLNLYALRPNNMLTPSTENIFTKKSTPNDTNKDDATDPQSTKLTSSALVQCNYLSSLQALDSSYFLGGVAKRKTTPNNFTHRRRHTIFDAAAATSPASPHVTTGAKISNYHVPHLKHHHKILPREERGVLKSEGVEIVVRWVDDTCAAGTQEKLYSKEEMIRWCDEVGKAVRFEGGAVRALETFEQWLEVI